jgi:RNA polymerase sigma factor (sigma-70 family)
MPQPLDAESPPALLARVRQNDEAAARELVEHLYPMVAHVVRALLPRREEVEDLMQEVFLKMFTRLDQFRGGAPFDHWVSRIAVNTCLDHLRKQKVRPELRWADMTEEEQAILERVAQGEPVPQGDTPQAYAIFTRLLESLSGEDAWLLRQIEIDCKTLAEVCAVTGWNSGTARVRLFRARHRLQKLFRDLENPNETEID